MTELGSPHSAQATAAPAAIPQLRPAALPAELLDDDEIIELSTKPSIWFIAFASGPIVLPLALVLLFARVFARASFSAGTIAVLTQACIAGIVIWTVVAALQWASRLYVLTNRRVMAFRGVVNVRVTQCRLRRISEATLRQASFERPLRLGSIMMRSADAGQYVEWSHLARPHEIHEIVLRAVQRAQ